MTHSNFIIYLQEIVHHETPTEVLLTLISILQSKKQFAERITGIGCDMACTLFGRAKTLINKRLLPESDASVLIKIIHILFVDKWHVKGHTDSMCNQGEEGLLNPYLKKFEGILHGDGVKTNDQIVEQGWKTVNKLRFAKNLTRRKFRFTLLECKQRHNDKNKMNLVKKGYEFVPVTRLTKVRNLSQTEREIPTMQRLLHDDKYQKLQIPLLRS